MNAPHHSVDLKRQDWAEQTTCQSFINGGGTPDVDDVSMMLDMLADHWERLSDKFPEHAQQLAEQAHDAIQLAWQMVGKAIQESETDPRDIRDAERADWNQRLNDVRAA